MRTLPFGFEKEALTRLKQIERGELGVSVAGNSWAHVYAGNVTFVADDGWIFVVFNDCDEWDYLSAVMDTNGHVVDYDDIKSMSELTEYTPDDDAKFKNAKVIKA